MILEKVRGCTLFHLFRKICKVSFKLPRWILISLNGLYLPAPMLKNHFFLTFIEILLLAYLCCTVIVDRWVQVDHSIECWELELKLITCMLIIIALGHLRKIISYDAPQAVKRLAPRVDVLGLF